MAGETRLLLAVGGGGHDVAGLGQSLVRESLGGNYERLARFDPENLFRRNADVEPAG